MPSAAPGMAGGYPEMQQFNIPTTVGGAPPVQAPPRPHLQFPVFTPPAASSYGSTTPVTVPWTPPDLAGAINAGIKTGGQLATDFLTNRKTAQEIQSEEQVSKLGIAAAHDPSRQQMISYERTPQGWVMNVRSPAEIQAMQLGLAKTQAEIEASRAATGKTAAETVALGQKTPAEVAREQSEAALAAAKAKEFGRSGFEAGTGAGEENINQKKFNMRSGTGADNENWDTAYGGTNIQ